MRHTAAMRHFSALIGTVVGLAIAYGVIVPLMPAFARLRRVEISRCPRCGSFMPVRTTRPLPRHPRRKGPVIYALFAIAVGAGLLGVNLVAGAFDPGRPHPVLGGVLLATALAAILGVAYVAAEAMGDPIRKCLCGYRATVRRDGTVKVRRQTSGR